MEDGTTCCYALQDKVWVNGPGGERWEVYTVLADAGVELEGRTSAEVTDDGGCCGSVASEATACCAG